MSEDLVSVICAAYNAEDTIETTINSVLAQTYSNWELLVVDDCSNDKTSSVVQSYTDPRIKLISLPANVGSGGARNQAIRQAGGKFLAILDADDVAMPTRLEEQIALISSDSELVAVGCQVEEFFGEEIFESHAWPVDPQQIEERLRRLKMPIAHCGAMFLAEAVREVGGYDEQARRAQDYALLLKLKGRKMVSSQNVLVRYRRERPLSFSYFRSSGRWGALVRLKYKHGNWSENISEVKFPRSIGPDSLAFLQWVREVQRYSWVGKLSKQTFWLFLSRAFGAFLQAVLLILLGRSTTFWEFGFVNVTLGILLFLSVLIDFGLSTYSLKSLSIDKDLDKAQLAVKLNGVFSATFSLTVFLSCGITLFFLNVEYSFMIAMVAFWVSLEKVSEAEGSIFMARQRILEPSLSIVFRRAFSLAFYLGLTTFVPPYFAFGIALVLGSLLGYVYIRVSAKDFPKSQKLTFAIAKQLVKRSKPFATSNVFSQIKNLDATLIALGSSVSTAAIYSAANRLSSPIFLIASSVANTFVPAIGLKGSHAAHKLVKTVFVASFLGIVGILLALPILDETMIALYGQQYSGTGFILFIVSIATLLNAIQSPLNAILQSLNQEKTVARINLLSGITLLIALFLGSVVAGARGGALAYLGVMMLSTSTLAMFAWRDSQLKSNQITVNHK